jgi:hypothetical protein
MTNAGWPRVRARYEAWWEGELADRPLLVVTAPRDGGRSDGAPENPDDLFDWFTNPARVIPRVERQVADTHWEGDAFPVVFPVSTSLPAIQAAYMGAPYLIVPGANTGWSSPCIADWQTPPRFAVDPDNRWWRLTQTLLEAGGKASKGRYCVGIPDLQGGGQIVAEMRGSQRLAIDLFDHPGAVKAAIQSVTLAWYEYYRACFEIIHRHSLPQQPYGDGYVDWLGIWSDRPAVTVECDFSGMISPAMFQEFFLPAVRLQTEMVERSIYHLDGPGAIRHLDALMALPRLNGIQWVPGAGSKPMIEWLPLLKHIRAAGKLLVIGCEPWEVRPLLRELGPAGVLISTSCPLERAVALTDSL